MVEYMDNASRRKHLRLKGLKEGAEEDDLKGYVERLLMASIGSASNDVNRIPICPKARY